MQLITPEGLRSATEAERRFTIVPIYNTNANMIHGLLAMWADQTPQQAHTTLSQPDVTVTNKSDKAMQLPKILAFDGWVREVMAQAACSA